MYFDDFLAQQVLKNNDASPVRHVAAERPDRRLLRSVWSRVRQVARDPGATGRPLR